MLIEILQFDSSTFLALSLLLRRVATLLIFNLVSSLDARTWLFDLGLLCKAARIFVS